MMPGQLPAADALLVHDLRNALAVLEAAAGDLLRLPDSDASPRDRLEQMAVMARHASGLARRLLPGQSGGGPAAGAAPLNDTLRALIPELRLAAGPEHRLQIALAAPEACVIRDREALARILLNLVTNARAAAPAGTIALRSLPAPGGAVLEVEDDGPGLPEAIAARFDRRCDGLDGEALAATPDGHGLGLLSVARLVRDLGGRITVDAAAGRGTRFRIHLPDARPAVRGGEIVVVEDDPTLRRFLCLLLDEAGWAPRAFDKAEDAWAFLAERAAPPRALVTDMALAGEWTGRGLVVRLRQRWPRLPAILLSGFAAGGGTAADAEGDPVLLLKPVDPGALIGMLDHIIVAGG